VELELNEENAVTVLPDQPFHAKVEMSPYSLNPLMMKIEYTAVGTGRSPCGQKGDLTVFGSFKTQQPSKVSENLSEKVRPRLVKVLPI
jgi:hypothetical protein